MLKRLKELYFIKFRFVILILIVFGCQEQGKKDKKEEVVSAQKVKETLFKLLSSNTTNIKFSNTLTNNPYGNILMYQYFYNGGGVAAGDVNNDGLQDIYFTGNMVFNKLYINGGSMKFVDVTEKAGVAGKKLGWATGTSMADVNGDGLLDIYVCYSGHMPGYARANELFINQGVDSTGNVKFLEQAAKYNLADSAYSTSATFFDYDRDGDLDMFLLNHNITIYNNLDDYSIAKILKEEAPNVRVKLFRNNDNYFTEISKEAGLAGSPLTYGLGAGIADINMDGWQDIYVSNDYSAPDNLYINNGDGTFTDQIQSSLGHISLYSMGTDISDINNDGLPDIYTLDMLPEDNKRQKLLFSPDNYEYYQMFVRVGFHNQYMRNMLHLNNGNGTFSEIGQLAGVSNTDWSWAPLFADYDNDGFKDLFVSNGFLRDFTNLDFIKYKSSFYQKMSSSLDPQKVLELVNAIPSSNVKNYIFKNNGDLTFSQQRSAWGLDHASNSNGAAYADLDNDGDLELIINNINQAAFVYQNQADALLDHHFLKLKLSGKERNTEGIGAKVWLYSKGKQQYQELATARGYQSSLPGILHFGLGTIEVIDSLRVVWLDGKQQMLYNVKTDQVLKLSQEDALGEFIPQQKEEVYFEKVEDLIDFKATKKTPIDFKRQPLLINPLSFAGPCIAKADLNNDNLEDLYIGGAEGQAGILLFQKTDGSFMQQNSEVFEQDKMSEDVAALFVDINNDHLLDLYVGSGGYNNYMAQDTLLQDRLYINKGNGKFVKSFAALPDMFTSTSCVTASDINNDGFIDLFIGGRVIPGRYPEAPRSYLLINNMKGKFEDKTSQVAQDLVNPGMVTDAEWHDLDGDGKHELTVVGEWMPVSIFKNDNGKLVNDTKTYFEEEYSGWWNDLLIDDLNGDDVPELVIGNIGLNSQVKASAKEPASLYYDDFDDNGSVDPFLTFYVQGKDYPYVTRDELMRQMSSKRTSFPTYESYSEATIDDIFTKDELGKAERLSVERLETTVFTRKDGSKFEVSALPVQAQFSPVFTTISFDYNSDGYKDLLMCGNINQARLRFGKYDANYGILLQGNGEGQFTYIPQHKSGFNLTGDVRSIVEVDDQLIFSINGKGVEIYKIRKK